MCDLDMAMRVENNGRPRQGTPVCAPLLRSFLIFPLPVFAFCSLLLLRLYLLCMSICPCRPVPSDRTVCVHDCAPLGASHGGLLWPRPFGVEESRSRLVHVGPFPSCLSRRATCRGRCSFAMVAPMPADRLGFVTLHYWRPTDYSDSGRALDEQQFADRIAAVSLACS